MFCKIDSLYICVNDMERAIKFYEEFFEQEVSEKEYWRNYELNGIL